MKPSTANRDNNQLEMVDAKPSVVELQSSKVDENKIAAVGGPKENFDRTTVKCENKKSDSVEDCLSAQLTGSIQISCIEPTCHIGYLAYNNDLKVGDTYQGKNMPLIRRAISLPESADLDNNSEYVMVNVLTGMIQYYDIDDIRQQMISSVIGISVLVLTEQCISGKCEDARHGVLNSRHLKQSCFVAAEIQSGLCVALYEEFDVRFKKKLDKSNSAKGYHALVVPTEAMTLDEFVSRFASRNNWSLCRFAAGSGQEVEDVVSELSPFYKIALTGVDVALGKLIKILNTFGKKLNGSTRRLANAIRATIVSTKPNRWDAFIENRSIASGINVLLHHLSVSLKPLEHVSALILIESLQDSLNSRYGFQDEYEVVNLADRVNKALILPELASLPLSGAVHD